jgi:hypothetical protein
MSQRLSQAYAASCAESVPSTSNAIVKPLDAEPDSTARISGATANDTSGPPLDIENEPSDITERGQESLDSTDVYEARNRDNRKH